MTRILVALSLLCLPLFALAQEVPPADFDPMLVLAAFVKAVQAGQWPVALVLGFVAVTWALRKFGTKWLPWLSTSEGGTVLAFVTVMASVLGAAALAPGTLITWALVGKAVAVAFTSIGAWTGARRLLRVFVPMTAKWPWLQKVLIWLSGSDVVPVPVA